MTSPRIRPHRCGSLPFATVLVLALCLLLPTTPEAVAAGAPGTGDGGTQPVGAWPLTPEPEVVAAFDPPDTAYGAGHRGVDLAGRAGQPVRAALAGRIAFVGMVAGRPVVTIDHGATRTTYEPVASRVSLGEHVDRGDRIGRLEPTSSHCRPAACLHWGWLRGEEYLDPLRLVGAGPVRLLPVAGPQEFSDVEPAESLARPRVPRAPHQWDAV